MRFHRLSLNSEFFKAIIHVTHLPTRLCSVNFPFQTVTDPFTLKSFLFTIAFEEIPLKHALTLMSPLVEFADVCCDMFHSNSRALLCRPTDVIRYVDVSFDCSLIVLFTFKRRGQLPSFGRHSYWRIIQRIRASGTLSMFRKCLKTYVFIRHFN